MIRWLLSWGVAFAGLSGPCFADSPPPNVILIVADDLRFDALGFQGNKFVRTPHLDRLAKRGTNFTSAFCTTAICPVSRASIITGQYERRHRIADFQTPLTREQFAQSLPALMRKRGYHTGFVGKWGLGGELPAKDYDVFDGFPGQGSYFPKDKWGQAGEHLTAKQAAQAVQFLEGCDGRRPFFLQVSTKAPHVQDADTVRPFPPDPKHESLFQDVLIPKPTTATDADYRALPTFLQNSEARNRWKVRFETDELFQKSVKDYYRLIAGIDDLVGSIWSKLDEKRVANNTVILFTSDNGFYLADRGLAGKWFMHEESIRVPLLVCDLRRSTSLSPARDELALNIDVAPTILHLAGAPIPDAMQGATLLPLLARPSTRWRDRFFYEHRFKHPGIPMSEGLRTTRWKYIRYTSVDPMVEQLFDLTTDPLERNDLARNPKHADTLSEMRDEWTRLAKTLE